MFTTPIFLDSMRTDAYIRGMETKHGTVERFNTRVGEWETVPAEVRFEPDAQYEGAVVVISARIGRARTFRPYARLSAVEQNAASWIATS